MAFSRFGISELTSKFGIQSVEDALLGVSSLSSIDARISLIEQYENDLDIFNHERNAGPLSIVSMHPKENAYEAGSLYNLTRRYLTLGVGDHFNISLNEWFELPFNVADLLRDLCLSESKKKTNAANAVENQLKQYQ